MRWITLPLVAAAVGGAAISLPESRSAVAGAAAPLLTSALQAGRAAAAVTPLAATALDSPAAVVDGGATDPAAAAASAEEPSTDRPAAAEPEAGDAPPEEPPATEPPSTEPPSTEPPSTEPPSGDPAGEQPPAAEPPAEEPPATPPPPPSTDPAAGQPGEQGPPATPPPAAAPSPASPAAAPTPIDQTPAPSIDRPAATEIITADVPAPDVAARQTDYPLLAGFETRSADGLGGMSPVAADAYLEAEQWARANLPECGVDASFLAGIGKVESAHGTAGGVKLLPSGDTSAPIRDELGGQGPMHLLPSQWAGHAADGNGDGVSSADNMYDATVVTAKLLCELARELPETGGTLGSPTARLRVAYAFDQGSTAAYVVDANDANHGDEYAADAVRFADSITATLHSYGDVVQGTDRRIAQVVTWMRQQIQLGARYAATNPGRFGTPWDGVAKRSFISGRMYQYPAGTITYDCSGLMVVGFRQVGVDLERLGADWTGAMLANLPAVPRDRMQIGDLIILGSGGRTTHVVMYLGEDRYIHAGSCGGAMGVCEREGIDWSRVVGVVRVPLGETPTKAS